MTKITSTIWIGDSHDALHEKEVLKSEGITAILNCAWDLENREVSFKDGFVMAHCGLSDDNLNSIHAIYSTLYQLCNLIEKGHKILVHCHGGRSRSVLVVVYYLYLFENKSESIRLPTSKDEVSFKEIAKETVESILNRISKLRPEIDNPPKPLIECFERAVKCLNMEKM